MVKTMLRRFYFSLVVVLALVCLSCDSVPLLAPTNSSVTIDAQSRVVPTGGTTEVTATVIESSGTPVHNGTLVRFTATLGRMDPVEAQTRNGIAVSTFIAGGDSGMAEVRATSGGAGGGGTSTTPPTTTTPPGTSTPTPTTTNTNPNSNVVLIAVGSGAIDTITLRANPSTVSRTSSTTAVTVIATVVGAGGRLLSGIQVSFSANRGTFSSTSAVTDAQGEALVTLTTNDDTTITAVAGTKTATATVTGRAGPSITLTCAVGNATCATVSQGQTAVFTAQRGASSSNIASSTLDFGDGTSSVDLGPLSSAASVPHTYTQTGTFTARLTAADVNGETTSTVQVVQVGAATVTVTTSTSGTRTVTATATVSAPVTQYQWDFGDGFTATTTTNIAQRTYMAAGTYRITVVVTLQAGGSANASTTVAVP
jgi:large repetitive protein